MRKLLDFITISLILMCPLTITSMAYANDTELASEHVPYTQSGTETPNSSQIDQSALVVESLKSSNYESLTLEEVQKILHKKQELARTLDNQLRLKATRDQQKRALLDQLSRVDEENKKKLLELKQPFKK